MAGRKSLGFSFYVELPTEVSGKPEVRNIANAFDFQSALVSLSRLTGEDNQDYKSRLQDVNVHPEGPLYDGVINGISRALGLLRAPAIKISLKNNSAGAPVALSPRVDLLANRIVLYSDWRLTGTPVLDREIRIYQLGDPGYYLNDLVMEINESEYFMAELIDDIRPNTISNTLIRKTSYFVIRGEYVRADKLI